jgi:hypothetical protein
MPALIRRHLPGVACLAAAGVLCVAAVVDHRSKQTRIDRAQVAAWYCTHQGTHCGGESWRRIENRWNRRQLGYEIAVASLAGVALVLAVGRMVRAPRR